MQATAIELAGMAAWSGGAGPRTFVLVHGLGGTRENWRALFPLLEPHGRVVAPDLPGFGDSPAHGKVRLAACRDALGRALDALGGAPVYLIGNSLGGTVAILEAARRPDLGGLVLLDPAVPYSGGRLARGAAWAALFALLPIVGPWAVRRWLRDAARLSEQMLAACGVPPGALPAEIAVANRDALARWAARPDAARAIVTVLRSLYGQLSLRGRFRRALAAIAAPTAWLHGERDALIPLVTARAIARHRPTWTFEALAGGHVPQLEAPDLVRARVLDLVERAEAGRAEASG